ncbi:MULTISPECIES: TadE/TadG family type IV pilus assembly protein [Rhizobium/Agrobacterium group]|uniref:TadE/TadG family type IV pilus assembly protein n=1 Tax=Rhizobium/Agrobacterium group TaxID=227290 RepID=UPI0008DBEB31|nr:MULTISPECIES: TadE/TadG family type IV pilus assembly protein [Rhizobium/Agrobacterium group]MCF1435714.1 pilus assembly protein [Allorhizobium ampelinum]MCF1474200.1 pilus assembly protein [Allorhizobium ampelinum]MUO90312.1 pilus assembly protein [Agrobacterium vitis]MUZ52323.1 pilus assembly protein [Agrobacterium vitis]MUZ91627.1 pilus assembly protein [Agrobacterium vitis]
MRSKPALILLLSRPFRLLALDRSGVGAVEFALIVPLLLVLYLGAFELTMALSVSQRATTSAGAIADIVARQQKTVNKAFLATMPDVLKAMFAPTATTGYALKITGIKVDSNVKATIAWSWAQDGSKPYATGATVTLPSGMAAANAFFVHAELTIPHELVTYLPGFTGSSVSTITIARDYYFRQRENGEIACSDC